MGLFYVKHLVSKNSKLWKNGKDVAEVVGCVPSGMRQKNGSSRGKGTGGTQGMCGKWHMHHGLIADSTPLEPADGADRCK